MFLYLCKISNYFRKHLSDTSISPLSAERNWYSFSIFERRIFPQKNVGSIALPWNKDDHKGYKEELPPKYAAFYILGNSLALRIYKVDFTCYTDPEIRRKL